MTDERVEHLKIHDLGGGFSAETWLARSGRWAFGLVRQAERLIPCGAGVLIQHRASVSAWGYQSRGAALEVAERVALALDPTRLTEAPAGPEEPAGDPDEPARRAK
ncbi:hypothetical protein LCGC14_0273780 [marine sediment metagenome]|uniref:Uncharacterized protein n=2 Tax=root TaxID=1 RepID=A0A9C9TIL5_9HYPH|nr:hypothetical protein [Aurantimonas coralicida]